MSALLKAAGHSDTDSVGVSRNAVGTLRDTGTLDSIEHRYFEVPTRVEITPSFTPNRSAASTCPARAPSPVSASLIARPESAVASGQNLEDGLQRIARLRVFAESRR